MHEGPLALNLLHHARKTLLIGKLLHNNFTEKNSVAVDIQLCCLADSHLFSDFRCGVNWCSWGCCLGLDCKLGRPKIGQLGFPLIVGFCLHENISRADISMNDFTTMVEM